MADDRDDRFRQSPATRLLDALGRGDVNAALLEFRPTTIVRTEDRTWSLQGEDEVLYGLEDALNLFPGLVFDSHARHVGQGRVIEEARVRDLGDLDAIDSIDAVPDAASEPDGAGTGGSALVRDQDLGRGEPPRLNMPLRLTVLHDDQSVHEIVLSFPRALLRAAMGEHVDPLDMAVSEIQSAFVAPVGSGFTTYQLGTKPVPQLEFPPPPPEPVAAPVAATEPDPEPVAAAPALTPAPPRRTPPVVDDEPRRRGRLVVPLVVLLVALIAGGAWWFSQGSGGDNEAEGKPGKPSHSQSQKPKPTKKPSATKSPTKSPSASPTDKPDVVFKSDLAFDKGSAALSDAAKGTLTKLAASIQAAGLHGTIRVDGYTDNLGSEESGLTLSQKRADAVKDYLLGELGDYDITIQAVGHGEADPVASNETEAGRQQNRRVTINLPEQ